MTELKPFFETNNTKPFIIAEVAQSHDGSLGLAHKFIDVAKSCGATAIKFQTHFAQEESSPGEPFRIKFSKQDASRFEYWQRMEFSEPQWQGLRDHAADSGLVFLSSPFSFKAVNMLENLDMPAWKIGSGELTNHLMLKRILETKKPILLSTGMSAWREIDDAVSIIKKSGNPFCVFQTTSMYPTPADKVGLNIISELKERYQCPVGLSDHSATTYASLAAYVLGARFFEVHLTLSADMFGPDVSSSLTPEQFKDLVKGLAFLETALAHKANKDQVSEDLTPMKQMFEKSLVLNRPLKQGSVIAESDLAAKKPATGLHVREANRIIGRRLKRDVSSGEFLTLADFE